MESKCNSLNKQNFEIRLSKANSIRQNVENDVKKKESTKDVLNHRIRIKSWILQDDPTYESKTFVKYLRFKQNIQTIVPNKRRIREASTINLDGSLDISFNPNCWEPIRSMGDADHALVVNKISPRIFSNILDDKFKYLCNEDELHPRNETVENILISLILYRIDKPICRDKIFLRANIDYLDEKYNDDYPVILRFINDQTNDFPVFKTPVTIDDSQKMKYYESLDLLASTLRWTSSGELMIDGPNRDKYEEFAKKFDEMGFDGDLFRKEFNEHVSEEKDNQLYEDNKQFILSYSRYKSRVLPIKLSGPTPEDIILREQFSQIREDLYYSHKNNKLYTLTDLTDIFKVECKVIKNLNFKERSKLFKIINVNIYILNDEVDQLFYIAEARQHLNKFEQFKLNFDLNTSSMMLLGFQS